MGDDPEVVQVNTIKILDKTYRLVTLLQGRLLKGDTAGEKDLTLYEDAALFVIYHTFVQKFKDIILSPKKEQRHEYFTEFNRFWNFLFHIVNRPGRI